MSKKNVAVVEPFKDWSENIQNGLRGLGCEVKSLNWKEYQPSKLTEFGPKVILFFVEKINEETLNKINTTRKTKIVKYASRFIISTDLRLEDFNNSELSGATLWKKSLHNWSQVVARVEFIFHSRQNSSQTEPDDLGLQSSDAIFLQELARTKIERFSVKKKSKRFIVPSIAALLVILIGLFDWWSNQQPNWWYLAPILILLGIAVGPSSMNDDWEKKLKLKGYLAEHEPDYSSKDFEYDFDSYYTDSKFDYLLYRLCQVSAILITIPVLLGLIAWGISGVSALAPTTIIITLLIIIIVILLNQRR